MRSLLLSKLMKDGVKDFSSSPSPFLITGEVNSEDAQVCNVLFFSAAREMLFYC